MTPVHTITSAAGHPASAMVGTSGKSGERLDEVTARARTLSAASRGATEAVLVNIACTRPGLKVVQGGRRAAPRYGTCTTSMSAASLRLSITKWEIVPTPVDA